MLYTVAVLIDKTGSAFAHGVVVVLVFFLLTASTSVGLF